MLLRTIELTPREAEGGDVSDPNGILIVPIKLDTEQVAEIKRQWEDAYRGIPMEGIVEEVQCAFCIPAEAVHNVSDSMYAALARRFARVIGLGGKE